MEGSVEFILKGNYRIVALQFPDELLEDCVLITEKLQKELERVHHSAQVCGT